MTSPAIAAGFPPEYVDEDIGWHLVTASIAFIVLTFTFVSLRFISKLKNHNPLGLDDWLIIPALIFCWGVCIVGIVEVKLGGVGRHLAPLFVLHPETVVHYAKCGYAIEELYCVAVVFPKLSILASYLRIFVSKYYRYIAYALAAIIVSTAIAGVVVSLTSCTPFSARWAPTYPQGCMDYLPYWRYISLPNIITDVVMLVLPLPTIWALQVSRSQKLALAFVFLLGSVGLVAAIVRLTIFFDAKSLTEDGTYTVTYLGVWSCIEPGMYLIAACLPSTRPLFRATVKEISSTISSSVFDRTTHASVIGDEIAMESGLGQYPKIPGGANRGSGYSRLVKGSPDARQSTQDSNRSEGVTSRAWSDYNI